MTVINLFVSSVNAKWAVVAVTAVASGIAVTNSVLGGKVIVTCAGWGREPACFCSRS